MKERTQSLIGVALTLALAGCADLKGVQEFAATSSDLAQYPAIAQHYVDTPARVLAAMPLHESQAERDKWTQFQATLQAQRDPILKVQDTVSGYMGALAQLAGDNAFSLDPGIQAVSGSLQADPALGLDATHVQAYADIASKLINGWQAAVQEKDVKKFVTKYGDSMDKMLEALQILVDAMTAEVRVEGGTVAAFDDGRSIAFRTSLGIDKGSSANETAVLLDRRDSMLFLLGMQSQLDRANAADATANLVALRKGVDTIRQGHDDLRHHLDTLDTKEVEARLKVFARNVRSIRDSIKSL